MEFYKYKSSKQIVIATETIENEEFTKLKANTVDAALEKHMPVYEKIENDILVKVGDVEHPMTKEHHIMWIAQVYKNQINLVKLNPNDKPQAKFAYIKGSEIYAYCNLHGLWKTTIE